MRFWTREMAGWILIVLGLYAFYKCYTLLTDPEHRILEGAAMTVVGLVIFRGGIHLLKIAVAAQVCMEVQDRLAAGEPRPPDRLARREPLKRLTGRATS
jgi:hypothetical protein